MLVGRTLPYRSATAPGEHYVRCYRLGDGDRGVSVAECLRDRADVLATGVEYHVPLGAQFGELFGALVDVLANDLVRPAPVRRVHGGATRLPASGGQEQGDGEKAHDSMGSTARWLDQGAQMRREA
jgi:hypothetical protein